MPSENADAKCVVIIDCNYRQETPHAVYRGMAERLAPAGVELVVDSHWSEAYVEADLIIGADPIADRPSLSEARILGQRTLNRRTRLDVAKAAGAPVAGYGTPATDDELTVLAASWGARTAVLKYDWSARRNGVFLWPLDPKARPPFPEDFDPGSDVFMEFLGSDPQTYKIDSFGGVMLGAYVLPTRDMRVPGWHVIEVHGHTPFNPPDEIRRAVEAVSERLLGEGAGYASFDLMRAKNGMRIIEMNSCGVGIMVWDERPEQYAANYSEGIKRALARLDAIPRFAALRERALGLGNDEQAPSLPERIGWPNDHGAALAQSSPPTGQEPREQVPAEVVFMRTMARTERLPHGEVLEFVRGPAEILLAHARAEVPFYKERLAPIFRPDGSIDWEGWRALPLLTREDIAHRRQALVSRRLPAIHGSISHAYSAGTTAPAMTVSRSRLTVGVRSCIEVRQYGWHGIALDAPMATLTRPGPVPHNPDIKWAPLWVEGVRGREFEMAADGASRDQLIWLRSLGPVYARTRPSFAQALALTVKGDPSLKPEIRGLLTSGEILTPDVRRLCRRYLGHAPIDSYDSVECGLAALQCTGSSDYHLQSEMCLYELIDKAGEPCRPGEVGEIVLTPIYNLAMPLIRYATGDHALAVQDIDSPDAWPCVCGRTLPRIGRILGRTRNLLRFADAAPAQPEIDSARLHDLIGALSWQIAQTAPLEIDLRFVSDRGEAEMDLKAASDYLRSLVPPGVEVTLTRKHALRAKPAGRFEPYLCEMTG